MLRIPSPRSLQVVDVVIEELLVAAVAHPDLVGRAHRRRTRRLDCSGRRHAASGDRAHQGQSLGPAQLQVEEEGFLYVRWGDARDQTDWLQIMYRDAIKHDVQLKDWRHSLSPHMVVMPSSCEMGERQRQCSVTDAKSLFDCTLKEHPQGRQDRKASLELAIIVRDLEHRWVPHQKMIVDPLTKLDPGKANGAIEAFLKAGFLSLAAS